MRFFVKVRFRDPMVGAFARIYVCPSAKARKAILEWFPLASSVWKRDWLSTHFGQLKSFGAEYWGVMEPKGIPQEIQDAHPGIYRVIKCTRGDSAPNIDQMADIRTDSNRRIG